MNSTQTPSLTRPAPEARYTSAVADMREVLEQLAALYRAWSADPSLAPDQAATAEALQAQRLEAAREVGEATGALILAGWGVVLDPPEAQGEPEPTHPPVAEAREVAVPPSVHAAPVMPASPPTPVQPTAAQAVPPAPPAPPKARPVGPPPAPSSLAALQQRGLGAARAAVERDQLAIAEGWQDKATNLLAAATPADADRWIPGLDAVLGKLTTALPLGQPRVHAWFGLATCLLRATQADPCTPVGLKDDTLRLLKLLGKLSKQHQPGFVHGLAQHHEPEHGTWAQDAAHHRDALGLAPAPEAPTPTPEQALEALRTELRLPEVDVPCAVKRALRSLKVEDPRLAGVVAPHLEALSGSEFKRLRKAVRTQQASESPKAPPAPPDHRPPDDSPLFALTRGKRCLLVGNTNNPQAAELVRRTFDFADVEWLLVEPRQREAGKQRIASGTYALVVLSRFRGHDSDDVLKLCMKTGTTFVHLKGGYNPGQIRHELERSRGGAAPQTKPTPAPASSLPSAER